MRTMKNFSGVYMKSPRKKTLDGWVHDSRASEKLIDNLLN